MILKTTLETLKSKNVCTKYLQRGVHVTCKYKKKKKRHTVQLGYGEFGE